MLLPLVREASSSVIVWQYCLDPRARRSDFAREACAIETPRQSTPRLYACLGNGKGENNGEAIVVLSSQLNIL
jgi:hypothetical protein